MKGFSMSGVNRLGIGVRAVRYHFVNGFLCVAG